MGGGLPTSSSSRGGLGCTLWVRGKDILGEGHLGRRTKLGRRRGSCPATPGEGRASTLRFQEAPSPSPLGRWEDRLGLGDGGRLRGPPCTRWGRGLLS